MFDGAQGSTSPGSSGLTSYTSLAFEDDTAGIAWEQSVIGIDALAPPSSRSPLPFEALLETISDDAKTSVYNNFDETSLPSFCIPQRFPPLMVCVGPDSIRD